MKTFFLLLISVALSGLAGRAAGQTITAAEYYIDSDDGLGQCTPVAIGAPAAALSLNIDFTAGELSSLSPGVHRLGYRVQDSNGVWSPVALTSFLAAGSDPVQTLEAAEYFVDTDPGLGAGTALTPVTTPADTRDVTLPVTTLSEGVHKLCVRYRNAAGVWSPVAAHSFLKTVEPGPAPDLVSLEWTIQRAGVTVGSGSTPVNPAAALVNTDFSAYVAGLQHNTAHTIVVRAVNSGGVASPESLLTLIPFTPPPTVTCTMPVLAYQSGAVTLELTASGPTPGDQAAGYSWLINWGDSSPVTNIGPNAVSPRTAGHAWTTPGTYTVTVTTTGAAGVMDVKTLTIIIDSTTPPVPVIHYALDETTGNTAGDTAPVSGAQNAVAGVAASDWQPGIIGGGVRFSATGAADVDESFAFTAGAPVITAYPLTLSAWVNYPAGIAWNRSVAFLGDQTAQDKYFDLSVAITTGVLRSTARNTTANFLQTPADLSGGWHLVTGVFTSATARSLYLDGALIGEGTASVPLMNTTRFAVGALRRSVATDGYAGMIDDVALYGTALNPVEVALLNGLGRHSATPAGSSQLASAKEVFITKAGGVNAGPWRWTYATGLTGAPGSTSVPGPGNPYIVLDPYGNGLTGSPAVPVIARSGVAALTVNEGAPAANAGTFSDPQGNATVAITASLGTVTQDNGGGTWSWSHTPADGPIAATTVTITATDDSVPPNRVTATFTLTVDNVAPAATAQSAGTPEDTPAVITLAATDPGNDTQTYSIVNAPPAGEGTLGTVSGNAVTFTPALNFHGSSNFTFKATDSDGAESNPALVSLTVTAVNDVPVAMAQAGSLPEDGALLLTLAASDEDGDPLGYQILAGPLHGTLSGAAPHVTYKPVADYYGPDSFTFKTSDGTADSNMAVVSLTVTPVNDAPVGMAPPFSTLQETAASITLSAADPDSNPLTYTVSSGPAHGSLSGAAPALTYTPVAGFTGTDSFTFKANDGIVDSAAATIFITVLTPDTDGDCLPDAWEIIHFGNLAAQTAADDADQDGLNNLGEYAFDLDPKRGGLSGLPQAVTEAGLLTLSVTKQKFITYTVEASVDLTANSWGSAGLTVITDTVSLLKAGETAGVARRFFRMRALWTPAP